MAKAIIHIETSLDGAFKDLELDVGLYYEVAARFEPDIVLVGSTTAKSGAEMMPEIPKEEKIDFVKPKKEGLPYMIVPDSRGIMKGLLHIYRRLEFVKDVIVLVSEKTPKAYLKHLTERDYDHYVVGKDHVDLRQAFALLEEKYQAKTIRSDSGATLSSLLLDQGLADEVSVIISPQLAENKLEKFFRVNKKVKLQLQKSETLNNGHIWLVYKVLK